MTRALTLAALLTACSSAPSVYAPVCADAGSTVDQQVSCMENAVQLARTDAEAVTAEADHCADDRECRVERDAELDCTRDRIEREGERGEEDLRGEPDAESRRARLLRILNALGIEIEDLRQALADLRDERRERREERREDRMEERRERCDEVREGERERPNRESPSDTGTPTR